MTGSAQLEKIKEYYVRQTYSRTHTGMRNLSHNLSFAFQHLLPTLTFASRR